MNEGKSDVWQKKEIESHSSLLTNVRLDKFFYTAGELNSIVTSSRPNAELAMAYFASVETIFLQSHFVYALEINKEIGVELEKSMKEANIINSGFQLYNQFTPEEVINLTQLTKRMFYLIVQGLQNLRYFLRISSSEPRGIDAALEIFQMNVWKRKEKKNDTTIQTAP